MEFKEADQVGIVLLSDEIVLYHGAKIVKLGNYTLSPTVI